jgi:Tol biopolymer transport system component
MLCQAALPADGGTPTKLLPPGSVEVAPAWSPDGHSIYFNYYPFLDQTLHGVRRVDLDTRQMTVMPSSRRPLRHG